MGQKRRRLAHSCTECRRQKLKCSLSTTKDFSRPCTRCEKRGQPEQCKYVPYAADEEPNEPLEDGGNEDTPAHEREDDGEGRPRKTLAGSPLGWFGDAKGYEEESSANSILAGCMSYVQPGNRIQDRSSARGNDTNTQPPIQPSTHRNGSVGRNSPPFRPMLFASQQLPPGIDSRSDRAIVRGSGFQTQYHGPSHAASLLLDFPELSKLVREVLRRFEHSMENPEQFLGSFKRLRAGLKRELSVLTYDRESILRAMPDRQTLEHLVALYLDNMETAARVVHVPSFRERLQRYFEAPHEASEGFLIILLLISAICVCGDPTGKVSFIGRMSSQRLKAIKWVTMSDLWLRVQSYKHATIETFQVRVLLIFAKRLNVIKRKRGWSDTGELVRVAMASGLHREPSQMRQATISPFDQEMRRRLWATIVELETSQAFDSGIPPSIPPDGWDTEPPSNIGDEEFDKNSRKLPPSRPLTAPTRSTCLHFANRLAPLRLALARDLNQLQPSLSPETVAEYDSKLRIALAEWTSATATSSSGTFSVILGKLQLHESLLMLHRLAAIPGQTPGAPQFFSRMAAREAAASILTLYRSLSNPQLQSPVSTTESQLLSFIRNDSFRAGLWLCFDLCHPDPTSFSGSVTLNTPETLDLLRLAVSLQWNRIARLGEGFYGYWMIVSAETLSKGRSPPQPSGRAEGKQATFEEIANGATMRFVEATAMIFDGQETRLPPTFILDAAPAQAASGGAAGDRASAVGNAGLNTNTNPNSAAATPALSTTRTPGATELSVATPASTAVFDNAPPQANPAAAVPGFPTDAGWSSGAAGQQAGLLSGGMLDPMFDLDMALDPSALSWPEVWGLDNYFDGFVGLGAV